MKYCSNCGGAVEVRKEKVEWYCPGCRRHLYANPIPTIDAMLIDEDGRILLGRRSREPYKGKLNLPGGFVDPHETFEEAVARELKEELGLRPADYGRLTYVSSRVDSHTQEDNERQTLAVIMAADIAHRDFDTNDEVDEYVWKLPSELVPEGVTNEDEYKHIREAAASRESNSH